MWERIVIRVNQNHPAAEGQFPVKLIPAGRIPGRVVDEMTDGRIPGFTSVSDLFSDDIHLNNYGKFIIGAIHAAVLTFRDPRNFGVDATNRWSGDYWNVNHNGHIHARPSDTVAAQFLSTVRLGVLDLYENEGYNEAYPQTSDGAVAALDNGHARGGLFAQRELVEQAHFTRRVASLVVLLTV